MKINQRYIFFTNETGNDYEKIKKYRNENGYETCFIDYSLDRFHSKQYASDDWIHSLHIPSKELGMIWNEKIHLLKLAKYIDDNQTEFYIWIDAGVCVYRENKPPQKRFNLKDINSLPKNKLCYSHVIEDYHEFAATVLIIHSSFIDEFHYYYYEMLKYCVENISEDKWRCGSEQFIFTKLMEVKPDFFYKIAEGYGQNLVELYDNYV